MKDMIYPVYAIRDRLVGFGQLMIEQNVDTAKRNFSMAVKSGSLKTPEDYDLYLIGTYNLSDGHFKAVEIPEFIVSASDYANS